jgi:hypothetical protein
MTPAHRRIVTLLVAGLVLALVHAPAFALEPGSLMFAASGTSGNADFTTHDGNFLSAYEHGEIGVHVEGWYFLQDALAFSIGGGIGRFRERQAFTGATSRLYTQRSWHVRAGFDRVIDFKQDALFYFGPGLEYWRGHARFDGFGLTADQIVSPTTQRLGVCGRFGGILVLGDSFGINGSIGYHIGYARAEAGGAKTTWFPNGYDAAAGIVVAIGL